MLIFRDCVPWNYNHISEVNNHLLSCDVYCNPPIHVPRIRGYTTLPAKPGITPSPTQFIFKNPHHLFRYHGFLYDVFTNYETMYAY